MAHTVLQLDKSALLWINSHHNAILDAILAPVAYAGDGGAIWFLLCAIILIWGKAQHKRTALTLVITVILVDRCISAPVGHHFDRLRPYLAMEEVRQVGSAWTGSSFPSAHAHSVWEAAIILGSRWRKLIAPLIVFALLTCYSRPYCGMHYPGDVAAGSVLGIAAGFAAVAALKCWESRSRPGRRN